MSYDFTSLEAKFSKLLDHVSGELSLLRTGKATPSLLDSVVVEAYGTRMKINELANVSAPDTTLLVVTPWDKSVLGAIERGITIAQLNLNPIVDGNMIRIVVPALNEERRKEMVKVLHAKIEDGKKMMRTIRSDEKRSIEQLEDTAGYSEDDVREYTEKLDEKMKLFLTKLDDIAKRKETELMTV